ncbi:MAG: PadR family transcriptional regulator [Firmicutes bacterium]|nr:PadR family transcriptional regulator [Bacillota bacterium]
MFQPGRYGRGSGWIEACLLCLLKEEKSYGYSLMEKLNTLGFTAEPFNISVIYRNLRSMEKRRLVASFWTASERGPDKRMYEITQKGEKALKEWIRFLKKRQKLLQAVVDKYESMHLE